MAEQGLLESVFALVHALKREMQQQIDAMGLAITPMHVRVLKVISRREPCTANDVVMLLQRDKAQVTRLLKPLLEHGLLQKQANPEDKRSQFLQVTDAGAAIVERLQAIDAHMLAQLSQSVPPEDLAEFQRIARRMAEGLNAGAAPGR
ncbi:MarR family winged helix-turn-helix transcriptional regulator [Ferrimonas balearica]|uniref:MarR family winged helix-turn-helix transcriptional regulator n=1 Tax=Ferrimonas balearica TaxID=44012 RepID=UPI001C93B09F|nr:MarR family transcriptional regulator [Ferrimonas balearica]MBY5980869.1 MarR family transcriptional regulator [Ferrimonas balearica]